MAKPKYSDLVGRPSESMPEDNFNFAKRSVSNDLFSNEKGYEQDLLKAIKIIGKLGYSKKTAKLTKNLNLKIKEDLKLTEVEYIILVPFLLKKNAFIGVDGLLKLSSASENIAIHLYSNLFAFVRRGILDIYPSNGDVSFWLASNVSEYLRGGELKVVEKNRSLKQVIRDIDIIANLYNSYKSAWQIGELEIINLLAQHKQYQYCQILLEMYMQSAPGFPQLQTHTAYYEFIFYIMGHMILNTPKIEKDENLIEVYVNRDPKREQIINEIFSDDDHPVFKNKIFERSIDESGKADKDCVELHPDFKRKVLFGICKEVKREDVIPFAKITEQKLFYNEANEKAINDLSSLLQKDRFDEIKERLKTSGTRTGFACIFSGFPGTGKTATALQLAKQTGRDIIKVDMSGIRSKWWGEDEKNIKAIFNNYRSALQESRIEPILLLNEADAIIGKRLDVTGHNGALITAINTVQNIILEELENFEGILIATTNLTQNMDSAFERRFLYKIEFEKPNVQNRAKIWENMLQLPNDDALSLANQFDFTGAQIENIFRKKIANSILYGDNYDINQIIEMCKDEKVKKETKIGFGS